MKKSSLLGVVLFSHLALLSCGEENPQLLGNADDTVQPTGSNDGTIMGNPPSQPFNPSPPPGSTPTTGGPATPPLTPGQATVTPGPADTSRPPPAVPPMGTDATPPATAAPTAAEMPTAAPPATTPAPTTTTPAPVAGGSGNVLVPTDEGWVASTTNGAGVQGGWYDYMDMGGTTSAFTVTAGKACISGTTAQLVTDGVEWGAGMGLVLNDGGEGISNAWDGSAYTGFSFDVELTMSQAGAPATVELVMATTDGGAPHQKTITAGANTVTWTTAMQPTWAPTMVALDASLLTKIQFKIGTTSTGANDFTLCISNLTVM